MRLPTKRNRSSGSRSPGDENDVEHREESAVSITRTVAAVKDETAIDDSVPPEFPVQLYDYVDVEALDQLLAHAETKTDSEWTVTFAVDDFDVTVTSDGTVSVK